MNPAGLRMEEKKTDYPSDRGSFENKSQTSYRSTQSSRSSVLERAREYNRRIDEQNRRRAKSLERVDVNSNAMSQQDDEDDLGIRRSQSTGRQHTGPRLSTRARAMASVQRESSGSSKKQQSRGISQSTEHTHPLTPASQYSNNSPQQTSRSPQPLQNHSRPAPTTPRSTGVRTTTTAASAKQPRKSEGGSSKFTKASRKSRDPSHNENDGAIVSPELLVDALSGHEDGLLAIAEKMMEHYDGGYDAMGEAIIDAFADVQKLFQHVVEAAHMEGAAFEASRRESEMTELRRQAQLNQAMPNDNNDPAGSPQGPTRHDEFIDQDVKDVLTDAIRKGTALREHNKHMECYELYERASQAASSLLPVDSDHRGRLQLSIARAESMSPDRGCAILRYAMDDVLRSGMRAVKNHMPDPSQRADVVLSRPKGHPSLTGVTGQAGVVQSADEALASLMEELKECMSAPVYNDTPLQSVAKRFWVALNEAQKAQQKNEERLEQSLAKLKGEFLLARAEWEEKLTTANETAENYKDKYTKLKETTRAEGYMDQARSFANRLGDSNDEDPPVAGSVRSVYSGTRGGAGSVASLGSGLAQHAKTIVQSMNNFNCNSLNERSGPVVASELLDESSSRKPRVPRTSPSMSSSDHRPSRSRKQPSRSFREYSRSPQRVDV